MQLIALGLHLFRMNLQVRQSSVNALYEHSYLHLPSSNPLFVSDDLYISVSLKVRSSFRKKEKKLGSKWMLEI